MGMDALIVKDLLGEPDKEDETSIEYGIKLFVNDHGRCGLNTFAILTLEKGHADKVLNARIRFD